MKGLGKQIRNALTMIDLYSEKYNFLFKKEETYSHPLGQFLSLVIIALTSFSFISLSIQMFSLSNPNLVQNVQANLNPELYPISPENFFIAVGMGDQRGYPVVNTPNETWYQSKMSFCRQITTKGNISQKCVTVDFIPCTNTNFNKKFFQVLIYWRQGIEQERLALATCPNLTEWERVKDVSFLKGIGSSNDFAFMFLTVSACNYSAIPNTCVDFEKLKARLGEGGYMQAIFTDRLLDQSKVGDPYNLVAKTMTTPFTMQSATFVRNTLRHSHVVSTENFLYYFPQSKVYHSLILQNQVEVALPINLYFMKMNFFLDDRVEYFTRTYSTFFDVLGSIGGFQQFLFLIFGLFISPMTKRNQKLALVNQVFSFEDQDDQQKQTVCKSLQAFKQFNSLRKSQIVSFDLDDSVNVKKLLNQKKKLKLKWYENLIMTCGKKKSMFDISVKMLDQQIDVSHIINKVFELEKLKRFLLDDDQLKLFEYIPKPVISHKNIENGIMKRLNSSTQQNWLIEEEDIEIKFQHALDSFRLLKQSQNPLNVKLIQMMDPSLRDLLDNHTDDFHMSKSGMGGFKKILWDDLGSNKSLNK